MRRVRLKLGIKAEASYHTGTLLGWLYLNCSSKMKIVLLVIALCVVTLATSPPQRKYKIDDPQLVQKQEDVLKLFNFVNQPSYYKGITDIADSFQFEQHWDCWTKPQYGKDFWFMYQNDFLPQGEIFSIFYPEHMKQAIALFNVFYYAKNYESFYTLASWARNNINTGMYIYSLSVAIVHRDDMHGVILPPIYEVMPHYFFNDEVMYNAQQYKQHYWGTYDHEKYIKDATFKGFTIPSNYSGWYMNVHPEQSMTYFTEDVGMNAYYYYYNLHYPFWMEGEEFGLDQERRGEQYYYVHQQLLARTYLERLSNDLGEIPHFEYEYPLETGYYPTLHYPNGLHFPMRPNHAHLYYHGHHGQQSYGNFSYGYTYVKDYERRLRDAIDAGVVVTEDRKLIHIFQKGGFEMLGNLVESNPGSPNARYYGDLQVYMRHLLGYAYYPLDEYKLAPSALEHFETSLRDPMFYQMYKRMMHYFHQYKSYVPAYTRLELIYPGVKIAEVEIDQLVTYFDYFYSDISNAAYVDKEEFIADSFKIRARQHRLNHKPFNYKLNVIAEKPTEAFVKVFIGPKYDEFGREIAFEDNNYNFVEFDRFHYGLQSGVNTIDRSSQQSFFASDRTTFDDMYRHVLQGAGYQIDASEYFWTMPNRFLLPKGKVGGQTYQFYFFIAPYHGTPNEELYPQIGSGSFYMDNYYPMGYPLDREIGYEYEFDVPNAYLKDVTIFHKIFNDELMNQWTRN